MSSPHLTDSMCVWSWVVMGATQHNLELTWNAMMFIDDIVSQGQKNGRACGTFQVSPCALEQDRQTCHVLQVQTGKWALILCATVLRCAQKWSGTSRKVRVTWGRAPWRRWHLGDRTMATEEFLT